MSGKHVFYNDICRKTIKSKEHWIIIHPNREEKIYSLCDNGDQKVNQIKMK